MSRTLFLLTAASTTAFIITILSMIAMMLGNPQAPANLWFNVHGATVLITEVIAIGVFGMVWMMTDRSESLRDLRDRVSDQDADDDDDPETKNPREF